MQPSLSILLLAAGALFQSWVLPAAAAEPEETAPVTATGASFVTPENLGETVIEIPSAPIPAAPGMPEVTAWLDLTAAPSSLWQRIRNGFGLPDIATPLVREQEEWFASRPESIKRTVARSHRYLYHIVEEIEKRGMPSEIALLPFIESAFNPTAYSRAHASGIWQFIPETGKRYGLQQNFWYDGRRDVMAATTAALDYLEKLYGMFGNWNLALAAYNWGENAVARAIARNLSQGLPTDYLSLSMPLETRYYIPKLQAVKNIIANPARFGIELADVPNQPYFIAVATNRHIDVQLAARLAGVPLGEFTSLNPGHNRPVIKADRTQTLLLPAGTADTFLSNLETHDRPLVSWQTYRLKPGETIERVATRNRISVAQLKQVNGIGDQQRIVPGSTLLVPGQHAGTASHTPDLSTPQIVIAKAPVRTAHKAARTANAGKSVQARKGNAAKATPARTSDAGKSVQARKGNATKATPARRTAKKSGAPAKKTATSSAKKIVLAQKPR